MPISRKSANLLSALAIVCIAAFFAVQNYFIQDDAYIAYVYARNFAEGHGLVWYPGVTGEFGYTNFLYTVLIGLGIRAGFDPEYVSAAFNAAAYVAALWLAWRLVLRLSSSPLTAFATALALATHHSFSAYASGGLETMPVTALVLFFYNLLLTEGETPASRTRWQMAVVAALALLMRLDSSLLMLPGYLFLAFRYRPWWRGHHFRALAQAAAVPTLAVLTLLAGCTLFYGQPLPTSFYDKVPDDSSLLPVGILYIFKYFSVQAGVPFLLLILIAYYCILRLPGCTDPARRQYMRAAVLMLPLWLIYVAYVGGDFMEFRFFVPVLPFLYGLAFAALALCVPHGARSRLLLLAAVCVAGNAAHAVLFSSRLDRYDRRRPDAIVETTHGLYTWVHKPGENWRVAGQGLRRLFYTGRPGDVTIAVTAAGAIPYYSGLFAIDLMGLNSRAVLSHSRSTDFARPGHRLLASEDFLDRQGINLNIYHPQFVCKEGDRLAWQQNLSFIFPYRRVQTLLVPVSDSCYLVADYRKKHPRIDALIADHAILRYRDIKNRVECPPWLCLR